MKVLLVDDDVYVRRMLRKMIPWEEMGFDTVLEAENGEKGLRLVRSEQPLLIVTDVRMPLMNGMELISQIRQNMVDAYVIVLSAYNDFEYVRTAVVENVTDYFIKPLNRERLNELIQKIRQLVQEHAERQRFHELLMDRSFLKNRLLAIWHEEDYPENLFDLKTDQGRLHEFRGYCALILDTMYMCMQELGLPIDSMTLMKEQNKNFLRTCNDVNALREYTLEQVRHCMQNGNSSESIYIRMIERYVEQHYMETSLNVTKIAEAMHISAVYTGAMFKHARGQSLIGYINNFRLERSVELLRDMTLSIAEISQRVGYASAEYYTRLFHKQMGVTPTEYRERYINMGVKDY